MNNDRKEEDAKFVVEKMALEYPRTRVLNEITRQVRSQRLSDVDRGRPGRGRWPIFTSVIRIICSRM